MLRSVPLRRRLFLLVAAALLPLAAMAVVAVLFALQQQRAQAEAAGLEITRALAIAVDGELQRSIAVLELLAISPQLEAGDLKAFDAVLRRALGSRSAWSAINLAAPDGQQVASTADAAPLPRIVEMESFRQVVARREPSVGNLEKGRRGNLLFAVRVPVVRDGQVSYVLSAVVRPDAILEVVQRQRVPENWVISVFDAKRHRVARSRLHQENLGSLPSDTLVELMDRKGAEGTGVTHAVEGDRIYTAFSRLPDTRWSVAIGIPAADVEAATWRSFATLLGGVLASIALGAFVALLLGRRIAAPMAELARAAQALGMRARPEAPRTDIREIREVGTALESAADGLAKYAAEREALLQREQQARAAAESASRAKDEFLAMLGHELRNPLGAISNASLLLQSGQADAKAAALARDILRRQVEHLSRMTDDLLDAGRAITGKIALHRRPLELAVAARQTLATLHARTARHRVTTALAPVWIDADATRVEQILSNLVVNAVKYTPEGGNVHVEVRAQDGLAVLEVRDDGIGMPPELAAQAFELFVQGKRDLDRAYGGLGIGLTLVRRLAELHGGSAEAHSDGAGRGSRFTVRFPSIAAPAQQAAAREPEPPAAPKDILLIEDNADARASLQKLLELAGHRVRVAEDGAAGLAQLLAAPPDIALIDIGLPRMDGYEVARRARRELAAPRPYLVAITGYGAPEDRERALEAGFDEHVTKPVDAAALRRLVATPA
ncbi:MAG TPA: ATP-binding protein [Burkholderiales bacterium]|nr:ATP-binding protein [Burkholderiales bacterium]